MEYLEISDDEQLTEAVEHANEICLEPIRCNWDEISENENSKHSENLQLNDLCFKLGFNHIELMNSTMEERQHVSFLGSVGSLKTMTMVLTFKISDTYVNGKIRICSVLKRPIESYYKLHLTKLVVKSIIKLVVVDDSYQIDHILNEFIDARMSFVYKKDDIAVPVYNNIQDKTIKHSLVHYVVDNFTKHTLGIIESSLKMIFGYIPVSVSLKGELINAIKFRKHIDTVTLNFNSLIDEVINSTNLLIGEKEAEISIPDVSIVLQFRNDGKKSLLAKKVSLKEVNFLFRRRNISVSYENDIVLLHVPVDFPHLKINYEHFTVSYNIYERRMKNIEEYYKTDGSYLIMSLQNTGHKLDLNLLEIRIKNFVLLDSSCGKYIDKSIRSWIYNTLEFKIATVIENAFEKYFRIVLQQFDVESFLCRLISCQKGNLIRFGLQKS